MTGFGTFEDSARDTFAVTRTFTTPVRGHTETVTLTSENPSDQHAWLDTLIEQHGDILDTSTIRRTGPRVANTNWMVLFDPEKNYEPIADLTYSSQTDGLPALMRKARANVLGTSIETAPYRAFKSSFPDDPHFEIALVDHGPYAARTLITDEAHLLDAAAAFHDRASELVRWHGGRPQRAELRYGPLTLVNRNH
jgi:hypothetical protein